MAKDNIENGKMKGTDIPAIKPQESATAILKLVDGAKKEDNGKFFSYDGSVMPW
jgi:hypothetical protein